MSRKLVALIQDNPRLSAKHKRTLCAYAARANNDGTNIFASKETVGKKYSISRRSIYRNGEDLIRAGILVRATSHTCKVEACNKGATHYWGQQGKYTVVYNIDLAALENEQTYLSPNWTKVGVPKQLNLFVPKRPKVGVTKRHATQAFNPTPAPLGKMLDSSALASGINESTNQSVASSQPSQKDIVAATPETETKQNQDRPENPQGEEGWEMPNSGWVSRKQLLDEMGECWSAFSLHADPTPTEITLFVAVMAKCDSNCCYPSDVTTWARKHILNPKLAGALRTVKGLHKAICGGSVSSTNGLFAQYRDHNPKACGICIKAAVAVVVGEDELVGNGFTEDDFQIVGKGFDAEEA